MATFKWELGLGSTDAWEERGLPRTACINPAFQRQPGPVQIWAAVYDQ